MDSRTLALLCKELAENKKAEDVTVLDVRSVSSVTDFFVLVTGSSEPHLRAISSEILDGLRTQHEVRPRAIEGSGPAPWQVIDLFDVIIHVMRKDIREKYDLESLWGDAPTVKTKTPKATTAKTKKSRTRKAAVKASADQ